MDSQKNKKSASLYILRHACMVRLFILIAFYTQKKKKIQVIIWYKKEKEREREENGDN